MAYKIALRTIAANRKNIVLSALDNRFKGTAANCLPKGQKPSFVAEHDREWIHLSACFSNPPSKSTRYILETYLDGLFTGLDMAKHETEVTA